MKDKSKILGVLNTGKRHSQQKEAAGVVKQIVSGGGAMNVDLSDYLLKSVWDSVFEIRIDSKGETYIFGKLPVVTQYGITMYGEGGDVNIPSIYAGLPIDNITLKWIETTNSDGTVTRILGVNPDIELGGGLDTEELEEFLRTKNYATENWVTGKNYVNTTTLANELKKYVTLNNDETINGLKNFTKGIQINGLGITNTQDDVIYIDANLVVRGGITMYATDTVDIPSILDSIPIASNTAKGLASFDATYFSIDNGHVTLLPDNVGLNEEELAAYLDDKKYATQSWVQSLKYATSTELDLLEDKVNDFLSGSDTDTIINKWKELEAFLSGLSESDNLATILGGKANKATTLAGYGITDAYTKSDVNTLLGDYVTLATAQTITGKKDFTTGGLFVNGKQIQYIPIDSDSGYWKLEGDLLVTGGVTMYGDDSAFTPSTIMSAIVADNTNLKVIDGVLTFVGDTGGGLTEVHWDDVIGRPTLLSSFICDLTIGKMTNIGSWADEVATQDRIMYQAANTSKWVVKNLSDLAVGGISGDYLPITGGELYSSTTRNVLNLRSALSLGPILNLMDAHGNTIASFGHIPKSEYVYSGSFWINNELNTGLILGSDGGVYISTNAGVLTRDLTVLHSVNFSRYALPLSGGTLSNVLTISNPNVRKLLTLESTNTEGAYMSFSGSAGQANVGVSSGGALLDYIGNSGTANINLTNESMMFKLNSYPSFEINREMISLCPVLYPVYKAIRILMDRNSDSAYIQAGNYNCNSTEGVLNLTGINGEQLITLRLKATQTIISHGNNVDSWLKFMGNGAYSNTITFGISGSYQGNYLSIYNYVSGSLAARITGADLLVYGGITMYSDIRKKTKLQDVELSLSQIANAPLIEHYYNSDDKRTTHVGSIAQYWAGFNDWFCKKDQDGFYTMEIQNAALASAISVARHLQEYETKTDRTIRKLKKRISELEDEVEKLKSA